MIRATTRACAGVIFIASLLVAFQMREKVNKTSAGLAIKGYDPVAYFEDGKPMKGDAAYQFQWKGATWQFSSAAHREAFMKDRSATPPSTAGFAHTASVKGTRRRSIRRLGALSAASSTSTTTKRLEETGRRTLTAEFARRI